eukprot:4346916-Alexandrium_andersonii.AAC.1
MPSRSLCIAASSQGARVRMLAEAPSALSTARADSVALAARLAVRRSMSPGNPPRLAPLRSDRLQDGGA